MTANDYFDRRFHEQAGSQPAPQAGTPTPTRRRGRIALAAGVLALALVGGAGTSALTTTLLSKNTAPATQTAASTKTVSTANSSTATNNASAVYLAVSPSVVTITSSITGRFGQQGQATGSGVVIDTKGDIVTNFHVIDGANSISVTLSDGTAANATVIGMNSSYDLAVIRISVSATKLHPATLGDSGTLLVGDSVYAIGSPYGLSGTLTQGIVSGLNRNEASTSNSSSSVGSSLSSLIQTDAPINPGNSGGPLVNSLGEVIGINQSIESPVDGNTGIGFAIPINLVKQLLPALENGSNV